MASPIKRRVLAPLDVNASLPSPMNKNKLADSKPHQRAGPPPSPTPSPTRPATAVKRPLAREDRANDCTPKKLCLTPAQTASSAVTVRRCNSVSSSPSSVFDDSTVINTTQATNITEPDAEAARPPVTRQLTREQSRQRAEILKLRLGLARYKIRTGQVNVPLEQLRVVPAAASSVPHRGSWSLDDSTHARPRTPHVAPTLPSRRQCTVWGRAAAYSDSSSDEEDFMDHPRHRHFRQVAKSPRVMPVVPSLQLRQSEVEELDRIDRVEDSDGPRTEADEADEVDEMDNTDRDNSAKSGKKNEDGPQLLQVQRPPVATAGTGLPSPPRAAVAV